MSDQLLGRTADRVVDATRIIMEKATGLTPDVCPAFAMKDPLVIEVLGIYAARESNLLEPITGGWEQMSRRTVEGLRFFDRCYRHARAFFRQQEDERREAEHRRVKASSRGRRG